MSFYERVAKTALEAIVKFGQAGQIEVAQTGEGDPASTTEATDAPALHATSLAVFPINAKRVDGTNIKAGDFQVLVPALSVEIQADDVVICSEGRLTVIDPGKISPAGTVVVYDMVCRG